jgi:hypothetical protein
LRTRTWLRTANLQRDRRSRLESSPFQGGEDVNRSLPSRWGAPSGHDPARRPGRPEPGRPGAMMRRADPHGPGPRLTPLTELDVEWLHALVSDWQLLADLSFADLVLWAPLRDGSGWVALPRCARRPGPRRCHDDMVGIRDGGRGAAVLVDAAAPSSGICRGGGPGVDPRDPGPARVDPRGPRGHGHRGDRAEHQPEFRADPEPPGIDLPQRRGRPGADGGGGHLPLPGPGACPGQVATGRRRPAAARPVRAGGVCEPQRLVRLPQARPDRRPGRRRAGATDDQALLDRPARR